MPIQQKVWKIGAIVGILLAVYLLALSIGQFKSIAYIGAGIQPTNTISVSGTGDAYAIPDVATFSFTVNDTEKVVADAQTKVTTKINAAMTAVEGQGVDKKDIQTTYYSINPHYEYQNAVCPMSAGVSNSSSASGGSSSSGVMIPATPIYCPPGKSVITGYDVSESVSVKLRDTTKAGTLLVALGTLGVTDLNGPSFDVDNPDAVQSQARTIAIADAQSKAKVLAEQLGVQLVRIVSFSDDNGSYPQPVMYAMNASVGATKAAAVPDISTGQQKVTDNVTITYEIE
jgi:uncharacterized protein YggE